MMATGLGVRLLNQNLCVAFIIHVAMATTEN